MFTRMEEHSKELKEMSKKLKKLEDSVNRRLRELNAGFCVDVEVTMGGFEWDEWPTDDLRGLVEEFVSSEEALGIPIGGLEELLAVLHYREREDKKKAKKK